MHLIARHGEQGIKIHRWLFRSSSAASFFVSSRVRVSRASLCKCSERLIREEDKWMRLLKSNGSIQPLQRYQGARRSLQTVIYNI